MRVKRVSKFKSKRKTIIKNILLFLGLPALAVIMGKLISQMLIVPNILRK